MPWGSGRSSSTRQKERCGSRAFRPPTARCPAPSAACRPGSVSTASRSCVRSVSATTRSRRCWPRGRRAARPERYFAPATLRDRAALVADVVDQPIGAREERAALVDAGQLLDELREQAALLEHERVDRDALTRTALHFLQRLLEGAPGRRIGEVGLAAFHVRGRLAVGDHDDLFVAALLTPQQPPRLLEAVVHVGPDVPLAVHEPGQILG